MRYLVIDSSNTVINVALFDDTPPPVTGFIFVGAPGDIGDVYDPATGTVSKPAPTVRLSAYTDAVQNRLDTFAQSWGYDDIARAITYVGDPYARFNLEGTALRDWRSAVWVKAGEILATVNSSNPPSVAEVLAQLPAAPSRPVAPPPIA